MSADQLNAAGASKPQQSQAALQMPEADQFGFVKTMNNMGYMTNYLDGFSEAWVNYARQTESLSADIGAAYGVATLAALTNSKARVLAVDLDPTHLSVLEKIASQQNLQDRLTIKCADFPNELTDIKNETLNNILICRVLHFFDGEKLQEAINWCFEKMQTGGRLVLVCETPYLKNFQSFIPIYEERMRAGVEFPGFIEDVKAIAPDRAPFLPAQMHLLDEEVLTRVCKNAGFTIERTAIIPRPNFPLDIQLDGRESVGVIARKDA
jgi:precorrin-6B methylase 2